MGFDIDNDSLLEGLLLTVIKLIEQKLSISDDLLLLVWKYEMIKHPNEKENRLWNVLQNMIKYVLDNSKNKRSWFWFKSCIFDSIIWYELVSFNQSSNLIRGGSELNKKKGDASNDSNSFELICDCGCEMELNSVKNVYGYYIYCVKCSAQIPPSDYVYRCPKGKSKYHPNKKHFHLCASCGDQRAAQGGRKHAQQQQENKNSRFTNKQNIDANILFSNLHGMTDDRLLKQKEQFKQKIDKLSLQQSWKDMISFPNKNDKNLHVNEIGGLNLRQDSKECLTFPNELGFDIVKLNQLNLRDFYDNC